MAMSSDNKVPQALLNYYGRNDNNKTSQILFGPGNGVGHQALSAALRDSKAPAKTPRSLNITLPFCPVRCLNCDSDSVITHDGRKIDLYLDGIEREAGLLVDTLGFQPRLQQLHLSGGSPNYLDDRQLVRLMAILDEYFGIDDDTEQSLDANPKRTSLSQLTLLRGLGFDQIAFGVRELDPLVQLAIGRTLSMEMIRGIFEDARELGFSSIGTDILYGLPCQTEAGIKRTIENLLTLGPDRIDCFAFSRHTDSRVHQTALDHCTMPSLGDKMALFNAIVDGLSDDYVWIGLDSFSKPDDDLAIAQTERRLFKSWTGYSHLPNTEAHGLGTSAITDLDDICVQNHRSIDDWSEALTLDEFPVRGGTCLDSRHRNQRDAVRTLMCNLELKGYDSLFEDNEWSERTWEGYARDGIVAIDGEVLRVTEEGRYILPHLLAH